MERPQFLLGACVRYRGSIWSVIRVSRVTCEAVGLRRSHVYTLCDATGARAFVSVALNVLEFADDAG
jgi:hypothetical protein